MMKKWLAFLLAAALLAVLSLSAVAENEFDDLVRVLMSSPGVTVSASDAAPTAQELDDAIEAGAERIPSGCKLAPGRVTLMDTGSLSSTDAVYSVTFKVWSTQKRTIGLFFRAEGSESWELATCNLGDVIEGRFETGGTYAIAVGW